ncbi:YceI family protein [Streptomyces kanamyceticus]|uniref:YceI family protein n=1 Tax=Streptomyces kanamyceticus TaxID=1967 RepID=A0A5J6GUM5_STRKN|nr:YceI family protein [Streptomyces kanamyceticus]QEU97891.1 YceI family protein [Streptomyces kanamyceticus]
MQPARVTLSGGEARGPTPEPGTYVIDAKASAVRFRTRSVFGLVPVRGTFAVARGAVTVADAVEESTVDVAIRADSFDSGLARRDEHVRSADYLDAAAHPEIVFRGHRIRFTGPLAVLEGELTVRGVSGPVEVSVDAVTVDERRLAVRGTATVDRYALGVTKANGMTGRRLHVDLDVHAVR